MFLPAYECPPCEVGWSKNEGPDCWNCGAPGRIRRRKETTNEERDR